MKTKGTSGKLSRTILFNMCMVGLDFIIINIQLLNNVLTPMQFTITFFVLGLSQKLGNIYLRTITTKPLA